MFRSSKWYEDNGWERREVEIPEGNNEIAVNFIANLHEWAKEQGYREVNAFIENSENPKDTYVVWGKSK